MAQQYKGGLEFNDIISMFGGSTRSMRREDLQNQQPELQRQHESGVQDKRIQAATALQELLGSQLDTRQDDAQSFQGGQNAANIAANRAGQEGDIAARAPLLAAQAAQAQSTADYQNELTAAARAFRTGGAGDGVDPYADIGDLSGDIETDDRVQALQTYLNQDVDPILNLSANLGEGFARAGSGLERFFMAPFRTPREKREAEQGREQGIIRQNVELGGALDVNPEMLQQLPPELLQMLAEGTLEGSEFTPEVIRQLIANFEQ